MSWPRVSGRGSHSAPCPPGRCPQPRTLSPGGDQGSEGPAIVRGHRALAFLDKEGGQGPPPTHRAEGCVLPRCLAALFPVSGARALAEHCQVFCPLPVVSGTSLGPAGDPAREASLPDVLARSRPDQAKLWAIPQLSHPGHTGRPATASSRDKRRGHVCVCPRPRPSQGAREDFPGRWWALPPGPILQPLPITEPPS